MKSVFKKNYGCVWGFQEKKIVENTVLLKWGKLFWTKVEQKILTNFSDFERRNDFLDNFKGNCEMKYIDNINFSASQFF